ncbi:MAG: 50S ribosomal protein L24 [Bacteroidetes bacterium]|nr:50S ribosomal protein L24 [Bacteroidota bacterium]
MKLKIKKGDTVAVITGNDKGKTGRVLEVDSKKMRILIEGISIRKKHSRPTAANQQGGILSKEMPIHYSNVQLVDSEGKPTRVSIKSLEKAGEKSSVRIARTNGKEI